MNKKFSRVGRIAAAAVSLLIATASPALAVTSIGTDIATQGTITVNTATATDDQMILSLTAGGAARFNGTLTSADLTGASKTWTLPDLSGTFTVLGNATTGTGDIVRATSPTLVTPVLGAATATSLNGLVVTPSLGTLTIANDAAAALVTSGNFSITLTATGATNVTLPTTGTLATRLGAETLSNKTFRGDTLFEAPAAALTDDQLGFAPIADGNGARFAGVFVNMVDLTAARSYGLQNASGTVPLGSLANSLFFTTSGATNVTLPATGTLATLAGTETLANKTLTDSTTLFQDEADNTKKLAFQLSGIATATTRTLTVPDADGTVCLTSSCLTSTLTSANIFVGNGSNVATGVAMSGDVTISNAGVTTIGPDTVALTADTTGNYVTSVGTSALTGLTGGSAGSEGAALSLALDYSATLAGNPALAANGTVFGTTGLIFEGATADGNETLLTVADPTVDYTITLPDASGTVTLGGNTFTGTGDIVRASAPTLAGLTTTLSGTALTVNGRSTFNGGTLTVGSSPVIDANQTWNNVLTTFTGTLLNITDTSSAAGSLLMDLQVGGASKWKVDKTGAVTQTGGLTVSSGGIAVTGNSSIDGMLEALTGLTVVSGGAAITGNSSVIGNLTIGPTATTVPAHLISSQTVAPTAAESGAGVPTVAAFSSDTSGTVTTSTTSHTTVTVTFNATYTTPPFCVISAANAAAAVIEGSSTGVFVTTTATTLVINTAADTTAAAWTWHCIGY